MSYHFKKQELLSKKSKAAFTLVEIIAAVTILSLISVSVITVINNCIEGAINSEIRLEAFELARENMEKLLASPSVSETVEFGTSDNNPDITWETAVETFYEPYTARMWVKAICSTSYFDYDGQEQSVELVHWITDISKKQLLQILKQEEEERLAELEAAEAAGTEQEQLAEQLDETLQEIANEQLIEPDETVTPPPETERNEIIPGYTERELEGMPFEEIWRIVWESKR